MEDLMMYWIRKSEGPGREQNWLGLSAQTPSFFSPSFLGWRRHWLRNPVKFQKDETEVKQPQGISLTVNRALICKISANRTQI